MDVLISSQLACFVNISHSLAPISPRVLQFHCAGVRYSLAEEHKQPLDSAPTVGLGPSTTGAEQWTLLLPSKHDHQHEKGQLLDLTGNSTITVPNPVKAKRCRGRGQK